MLPDAGKVIWVSYCKLYEEMTWDIKDYSEQVKRPCPLFWQVVHNMKYNLQSYEDFLSVKAFFAFQAQWMCFDILWTWKTTKSV